MAIRKLNLVMSYPINWSIYSVMNNFVQNFYDALKHENFMEHFEYKFEENTIILKSDVGFSKEWLFFMGASSKREKERKYAGKFGEGFKVASLVAYRDFGLGIQMESRDWRLSVTEAEDEIDGVRVKVLAYDIDSKEYEESSVLTLTNAKPKHFEEIKSQIDHFYYVGNAKFGKVISLGRDYAIYESIKNPKEKRNWGSLFINYQWRDSLDLPIVVCNHNYEVTGDDRDRTSISLYDSNCAIREAFRKINEDEAFVLLEICRPRWKNTFGNDYKGRNWYRMLEILIDKVAYSPHVKRKFLDKYGHEIMTTGFYWWTNSSKKKMALEWFRNSDYHNKTKVVSSLFAEFGIPNIYELCEKNNGFAEEAKPNELQKKYIKILENVAKQYFDNLFCYETLPNCRILLNKEAPILGKAFSQKEDARITNNYGHVVRSRVSNIYLQSYILKSDMFSEALVVYLHELLHQFGGDSSIQFKEALVQMNQIIIDNMVEINMFAKEWRAVENVAN